MAKYACFQPDLGYDVEDATEMQGASSAEEAARQYAELLDQRTVSFPDERKIDVIVTEDSGLSTWTRFRVEAESVRRYHATEVP